MKLRSKDGCPWDIEQTHESLKNCMIEEAYEVCEAIDIYDATKKDENLCEELGDVLLQVVMHSQIAAGENRFSIEDVIHGVGEKMIRRHPHVNFDDTVMQRGTSEKNRTIPTADEVTTSDDVSAKWEEIKQKEKQETSVSESLVSVPKAFPANIRATKVQKKAAKIGFDFENYKQVLSKVHEELQELEDAIDLGDKSQIDEEFGDLMFSMVNLSRFLQLNAENSLTNATNKFINRFIDVERLALANCMHLGEMSIDELNALWEQVK